MFEPRCKEAYRHQQMPVGVLLTVPRTDGVISKPDAAGLQPYSTYGLPARDSIPGIAV